MWLIFADIPNSMVQATQLKGTDNETPHTAQYSAEYQILNEISPQIREDDDTESVRRIAISAVSQK